MALGGQAAPMVAPATIHGPKAVALLRVARPLEEENGSDDPRSG